MKSPQVSVNNEVGGRVGQDGLGYWCMTVMSGYL